MFGFNPFSALTSKIYGALAIGAVVVAGAQTLRIEGAFCRDAAAGEYSRCVVRGFKQRVSDRDLTIVGLDKALSAERAAHQQTKLAYRAAQAQAAELEAQRLARVKAQQQEIVDGTRQDFARRLADARAAAERLRLEAGPPTAGERAAGPSGSIGMPGAGNAGGRAPGAPADPQLPAGAGELDWRLVATEQAIQLDELITFVERQLGVEVNDRPASSAKTGAVPPAPQPEAGR